MRYAICLIIQV